MDELRILPAVLPPNIGHRVFSVVQLYLISFFCFDLCSGSPSALSWAPSRSCCIDQAKWIDNTQPHSFPPYRVILRIKPTSLRWPKRHLWSTPAYGISFMYYYSTSAPATLTWLLPTNQRTTFPLPWSFIYSLPSEQNTILFLFLFF